jgi:hypothetical protein
LTWPTFWKLQIRERIINDRREAAGRRHINNPISALPNSRSLPVVLVKLGWRSLVNQKLQKKLQQGLAQSP